MRLSDQLSRLNLRQLLAATTIPLMLLVALVMGLVTAWLSTQEVASHYVRLGEQMTDTLASRSDLALLYESGESVADTAASLLANPLVMEIRVVSKGGKLVYQKDRSNKNAWQYPKAAAGGKSIAETPDAWLFTQTVMTAAPPASDPLSPELALLSSASSEASENLGEVHLALSKEGLSQARRNIFFSNLFAALGFSLLLVSAILLILRRISRPLEMLATTMHDARLGNLGEPAQLKGPLEIQEIGETYNALMQNIREREQELRELNQHLEERIEERTQALQTANKELETFSYSVSHDLRAPLRAIDGFSQALLEDYGASLDGQAQDYLDRIRKGAGRMGELIDAMLLLSRVTRYEMQLQNVNMSELANVVDEQLREQFPQRTVEFTVQPDMLVQADPQLLRILLENLLGNAWKYTAHTAQAKVALDRTRVDGETVYVLQDNGAGFDMRYAEKLFGAFQRLHGREFEGTGVGLATVHRILQRHGGRIWADAAVDKGATFFFTLPKANE
ncbi:MAG: ATP-binding protein [Sulfuricella sp.]